MCKPITHQLLLLYEILATRLKLHKGYPDLRTSRADAVQWWLVRRLFGVLDCHVDKKLDQLTICHTSLDYERDFTREYFGLTFS